MRSPAKAKQRCHTAADHCTPRAYSTRQGAAPDGTWPPAKPDWRYQKWKSTDGYSLPTKPPVRTESCSMSVQCWERSPMPCCRGVSHERPETVVCPVWSGRPGVFLRSRRPYRSNRAMPHRPPGAARTLGGTGGSTRIVGLGNANRRSGCVSKVLWTDRNGGPAFSRVASPRMSALFAQLYRRT